MIESFEHYKSIREGELTSSVNIETGLEDGGEYRLRFEAYYYFDSEEKPGQNTLHLTLCSNDFSKTYFFWKSYSTIEDFVRELAILEESQPLNLETLCKLRLL